MKTPRKTTIHEATASYEAWLGEQVALDETGLDEKHELMKSGAFPFLRATYYRWAEIWPRAVAKGIRSAREVLAVGDLHVENFGTWRDAEGRLIWGINDFDEASRLPYTHDLVRLAVSAHLAVAAGRLAVPAEAVHAALLTGYREGLEAEGRPVVLAEGWGALRRIAIDKAAHPEKFWVDLDGLPAVAADQLPGSAAKALGRLLPAECVGVRYLRRSAGVGSRGRPRFVAIAEWCGGQIAREAKAVARAAAFWAHRGDGEPRDLMNAIHDGAVRCRDPFLEIRRRWTVRRLAPDCTKIELADLPHESESAKLLFAMGWETANVHLGSATAPALLVDLASRPDDWLTEPVEAMLAEVQADWEAWSASPGDQPKEKPKGKTPAVRKAKRA